MEEPSSEAKASGQLENALQRSNSPRVPSHLNRDGSPRDTAELPEAPTVLQSPIEATDEDVIELVQAPEEVAKSQSRPSTGARKQAWACVVPVVPPFPNIFGFVPVPDLPSIEQATAGDAGPADTTESSPLLIDRSVAGTEVGVEVTAPPFAAVRLELPAEGATLQLAEAIQAEKSYAVPTDYTELGWFEIYQVGLCLSYKLILLRRDISPRHLALDEELSIDAHAFRPLTRAMCTVFASAGLPFNKSTEELVIRQQSAPPTKKRSTSTSKKKNKRRRPASPKRKYLVMPALRSPINARSPAAAAPTQAPSPNKRPVRRLDLKRTAKPMQHKIGSGGAVAIFRALRVNTALRSLTLENAGIDDLAMGALAAMLRVNCTLLELSLHRNHITHWGIQVLCEALEESPDSVLLRLDLSRNCITDAGVLALCRALVENETVVWLDVSWNQLSSRALLSLLGSLRENFALRELAIFGKDIDEDQYCLNLKSKYANDIATALRHVNVSFASICLSSQKAALPVDKLKSSRWVALPSRDLVELDALVISGLVPLNRRLLTLDLSNNPGIERWAILEILKNVRYCKTLKHVNLANTGLFEEVGEQIGELVASNLTLETIVMHGNQLHVQQLRGKDPVEILTFDVDPAHHFDRWILAKCLALNRPTQELNQLRLPQAAPALITGAAPKKAAINYSLRKLELFEVVFLARKVFYHLHMGRVALNGCGINSFGGVALADGVRNHASLEILEIENSSIGVAGGRAMAECVAYNASLTFLNLSWNAIGNDGILGFENALKANKSLMRLDLRGNDLSAAGIKAIAAGLKGNACLQELYLRWNTVCPIGAEALAQALSSNKTLRLLDIEHHTMGPRGASTFAEMLAKNSRLQELNMKGDDAVSDGDASGIGSDAASRLAVALTEKNRTLTHLNMAQNQIGRDGILAFSDLVKFNATLRILDLSIGEMDGKIADRFFACLSMNKTITKLNLAHNRISNEGMMACIHMLDTNRSLRELNVAHNAITEEPLAFLAAKWQRKKQQPPAKVPAGTSSTLPSVSLKWLCLTGNTMTEKTRHALLTLAPMVSIELDDELHQQR